MPMNLFLLYQEKMESIDASERLSQISTFAVGSGMLKKGESRRIISGLQRAISMRKVKSTVPASPQILSDIGIGFEEVKSKEKKDG